MNTGGDDALIFNVEQGDDIATDNETIDAVEGISVAVSYTHLIDLRFPPYGCHGSRNRGADQLADT